MEIAVLGGTGRTGRLVVADAVRRGHRVRMLARRPGEVPARAGVVVVPGSVTHGASVAEVVDGADAVVSCVGSGAGRAPTTVYTDAVGAVLTTPVRRIVAVSAVPAGPRSEASVVERRVLDPVLWWFFGGDYADMQRMEGRLAASDADWVVVRPPRLTSRAGTGRYRSAPDRLPRATSIPRGDLATALVDLATDPTTTRRAVVVAT